MTPSLRLFPEKAEYENIQELCKKIPFFWTEIWYTSCDMGLVGTPSEEMPMKTDRQKAILEIISCDTITTQKQLQEALTGRGYPCTQATLSRDIKELHLKKLRGSGDELRYIQEAPTGNEAQMQKLLRVSRHGILSYDTAGNLVVLKTLPGLAPGVCGYIDELQIPQLVGSVAGNDTVLLVVKNTDVIPEIIRSIQEVMSQK